MWLLDFVSHSAYPGGLLGRLKLKEGEVKDLTWFNVAMPPLMAVGAISARYRGTYSDAAPAPDPARKRPADRQL